MHSFKGLLKMALIVTIMICSFGPGVEGFKCYFCGERISCDKPVSYDCSPTQKVCVKSVVGGKVGAKECVGKIGAFGKPATSGDGVYYCDDQENCNGSGKLDSNVGLYIGLLMSGISLWFVIGSSSSGRLSFSPNP